MARAVLCSLALPTARRAVALLRLAAARPVGALARSSLPRVRLLLAAPAPCRSPLAPVLLAMVHLFLSLVAILPLVPEATRRSLLVLARMAAILSFAPVSVHLALLAMLSFLGVLCASVLARALALLALVVVSSCLLYTSDAADE